MIDIWSVSIVKLSFQRHIILTIAAYSMQFTKADNIGRRNIVEGTKNDRRKDERGIESKLISSNLHSTRLKNRCWTVVLNFNNGLASDSFICETLFSQTCRFYANREKSRTGARLRDAFTHLVTNNPFPIPSTTRTQADVRCIGEKAFCRQLLSIWMM